MRFRLILRAVDSDFISHNYNVAISAAVRKLLQFGHAAGKHDNTRNADSSGITGLPPFTFSLRFEEVRADKNAIRFISPFAFLTISIPGHIRHIIENVLDDLDSSLIEIESEGIKTAFAVVKVDVLPPARLSGKNKFILLAPLILPGKRTNQISFFHNIATKRQYKNEISKIITDDLRKKYVDVCGEPAPEGKVVLHWDETYIEKRLQQNKSVTKMIALLYPDRKPEYVVGIQVPFVVEGEPDLIWIGFECGFGEDSRLGFGMVNFARNVRKTFRPVKDFEFEYSM